MGGAPEGGAYPAKGEEIWQFVPFGEGSSTRTDGRLRKQNSSGQSLGERAKRQTQRLWTKRTATVRFKSARCRSCYFCAEQAVNPNR